MAVHHFPASSGSSSTLRQLFDSARSGRITTVESGAERFVVVDAKVLRSHLASLWPSDAVVVDDGDGWVAYLPGLPFTADGDTFDEVIDDLIQALREYAEDWNDHLVDAPNHKDNWALVTLTALSTDEQMRDWILLSDPVTG